MLGAPIAVNKNMRVRYTETALADISSAFNYLAREADESIATNVLKHVQNAIESLCDFPEQGRVGRVADTKELIIHKTSMIAAYRIVNKEVQILALIHSSRRWPDSFK
jgi:toxin ParE1/3/4